mmetsp:Transcript_7566/g.29975  ORF Transcript_7566/g.29975 Transcript_7566/m.29975 type:complete len:394 (+) Transcript_7566:88-1269(+)
MQKVSRTRGGSAGQRERRSSARRRGPPGQSTTGRLGLAGQESVGKRAGGSLKPRASLGAQVRNLVVGHGVAADAAERAEDGAGDVAPDDLDPAVVHGQVLVELRGGVAELAQGGPGKVAEVVVLVVVPDPEAEPVERAVVGVGLLAAHEGVVLGNEVARHGVEAHAEEGGGDEVDRGHGAPSGGVVDVGAAKGGEPGGEGHLEDEVVQLHDGRRLSYGDEGAQGVEEGLADHPDGLEEGVGAHDVALERGGHVAVDAVLALVLVVLIVVALERRVCGDAERGVRDEAERLAEKSAAGEVVADLVHGQGHGVVADAADGVRHQEEASPPLPLAVQRPGHQVRAADLNEHRQHDVNASGVVHALQSLEELGVGLAHLHVARGVRLRQVVIVERHV